MKDNEQSYSSLRDTLDPSTDVTSHTIGVTVYVPDHVTTTSEVVTKKCVYLLFFLFLILASGRFFAV